MQPVTPLLLIVTLALSCLCPPQALGQNDDKDNREKRADKTTLTKSAPVSDGAPEAEITDPLIRILVNKGILNNNEGRSVSSSGSPAEQRERLALLLRDKGIISSSEFEALRSSAPASQPTTAVASTGGARAAAPAAGSRPVEVQSAVQAAAPPPVIAAIAPLRVLQTEPSKHDGLVPDIKLGSGAKIKLYGFLKASLIHDSSSPYGNDFPLPGFLADTGPDASPEFHLKARSTRLGANFEWPDVSPKTTLSGRFEFDFEGNFTRSNNRNISTIRSSQPSIRLAYGRIDRAISENTSAFALFGQDWTPFGSSTLPNLVEITGLGLGYGTLYERAPQARFGASFKVPGNSRGLRFQPEVALVLPAYGNVPAVANLGDQLGYGERQGVDSAKPEVQGRFVTQFQLDKAPGVVPAQFIASWVVSSRKVIVPAANVPAAFRAAFPTGADLESDRWGYTVETQLPTRYVTLIAKYFRGSDLRFFFANQLFSNFTDTSEMTPGTIATGLSIDGSSTVSFGLVNGLPQIAPQYGVRGQGGFVNLGFPLSRIFGADPAGRNAGWSAYLHYGIDQAFARDVRRFGNRGKGDLAAATIYYRFNNWLTFGYEQSYYRTRAANATSAAIGGLPLFRGIPSRETHNIRSEFATIFTF